MRNSIAIASLAGMIACGSSGGGKDTGAADTGVVDSPVAEEVAAVPATSYHLDVTFKDGTKWQFDRDLSDKEPTVVYAFGSTHIGPAVSLMFHDEVYEPHMLTLVLNMGIVVGSTEHPIQCPSAGVYEFSMFPPSVSVNAKYMQFDSTVEGSKGSIEVLKWTTTPGEVFEGRFAGRILFDNGKTDKPWAEVSGSFHFTLPGMAGGQ